jgi:uncharacterized protein (TIGR02145 family)
MNGNDVLHLLGVITGIEPNRDNTKNGISFSPNPMTDYSQMRFVLPEPGKTEITLFDLSGKKLLQTGDFLPKGQNTYRIQGLDKGIYIVSINSGKYSTSGKIVCSNSGNNGAKIIYENTASAQEKKILSKGTNSEIVMQYNDGARLKLTGISGDYSTIVIDMPTTSKTITFNFIPCTDADINNYPTVQIGSQTWMAENLKTTKYNDGLDIPLVTNDYDWMFMYSPAYCWYNNNSSFKSTYGALYNFYAVNTGKLCPAGWHVPDKVEWATLRDYLINNGYGYEGSGEDIGKSLATTWGWTPSGILGSVGKDQLSNNSSGFSGLPGGYRYNGFSDADFYATWWADKESGGSVYGFSIWNIATGASIGTDYKEVGFSVRCLKD